jgi:vancomycin resistance protein VanJ
MELRLSQTNTAPSHNRPAGKGARRHGGLTTLVTAADVLYALGLILLAALNAAGPEETWFGSANLYLPQWLWMLPAIPLVPLTLLVAWRRVWLPLLCLLWVVGPVMGYCWHGSSPPPNVPGIHLRIMTYNIKGGSRGDTAAILRDLETFHPDVLQTQDSASVLNGPLGKALANWKVSISGQYIIASRLTPTNAEARSISFPGSNHHCLRATLTVQNRPITLINVHLLSPRDGLISVRHRNVDGIEANTDQRLYEAKMLVTAVRNEKGPLILTGDLNAPVQALVCRYLFDAGLRDAFAEAGRGYGYTYGQTTKVRQPYVRIDHIMVNSPWQVLDCWTGNTTGSDHIPVIADLFLPDSR